MTLKIISQILLAALGLAALYMSMVAESQTAKYWAPFVGLSAQPFWLYSAVEANQWGAFGLCCAYSFVYLKAVSKSVRTRHLATRETTCPSTRK